MEDKEPSPLRPRCNRRQLASRKQDDLRPFDDWTPNYVRKCLASGELDLEDAQVFCNAFGDGLTVEELTMPFEEWQRLQPPPR